MKPVSMKLARKIYRDQFGQLMPCPRCDGRGGKPKPSREVLSDPELLRWWKLHTPTRCCAGGNVTTFDTSAPGFRAWAREQFNAHAVRGKLSAIVEAAP